MEPDPSAEQVDITWHPESVTRERREALGQHRGCVLWFTGLSGSGKSTVANCVDQMLSQRGVRSFLLDGDNIRHGLNASAEILRASHGDAHADRFGLGFSPLDRAENIRRIGAVAQLFSSAGIVALTAFVSPYREDRDRARETVEKSGKPGDFWEIYVDTPLNVCEARDPKGLYRKARAGQLKGFTGIDAPYEAPLRPELHLHAGNDSPEVLAGQVIDALVQKRIIPG